jgi:4-amino-4-deoxy-L-arabinose transferase-like glycosyltransferase
MKQFDTYKSWSWLLLLVPIYLFVFLKLGSFHVRLWDESYFAVQAYEMLMHHSWLVPYYEGQPVIMGSKPPIQLWLQMISIKAFGLNEFALRFPSALAAASTILLVFFFARKEFGERAAWVSAGALLTMSGFLHFHTGRGMEADALLTLILTGQVVAVWRFIKQGESRQLLLLGLLIGIAFWVKSVAAFLMVPSFGVALILLQRKQIFSALIKGQTIAGIILALGLPVLYLVLREAAQPGHWQFMMERHVGRYANDLGGYQSPFYYVKLLATDRYVVWLPLAGVAMMWSWLKSASENGLIGRYLSIVLLVFVIFLSSAGTKYEHYLNPIHPLLALLLGYLASQVVSKLNVREWIGVSVAFLVLPGIAMFQKSQHNAIDPADMAHEMSERYLFNASNKQWDVQGLKVIHIGFVGALRFYEHKLALEGQRIELVTEVEFAPGDRVLTSNDSLQKVIERRFDVEVTDQLQNAIVYRVNHRRNE